MFVSGSIKMWTEERNVLEGGGGAGLPRCGRCLVDAGVRVQVVAGELGTVRGQRRVVVVSGDVLGRGAEGDGRLDAGMGGDEGQEGEEGDGGDTHGGGGEGVRGWEGVAAVVVVVEDEEEEKVREGEGARCLAI